MRKARGEPLILWFMLEETKTLKVSISLWARFGAATCKRSPLGLPGQQWLSPTVLPGCRGAKVGSLPGTGCTGRGAQCPGLPPLCPL